MTKPGEAVQLPNSQPVDPDVVHDPSTIVVEHNPKDPNSPGYQDAQYQTIHDLPAQPVQVPTPVTPTPTPR